MTEKGHSGNTPLSEFIPQRWANHSVWLSAYRVHGFRHPPEQFTTEHRVIELAKLQVKVVISMCNFNFSPRQVEFKFRPFGGLKIDDSLLSKSRTSSGLHIFFIGPVLTEQELAGQKYELENIGTAVSLVAVLCGRNAVFEHLCDQDITPRDRHIVFGGPIEVPWSLGEPNLDTVHLDLLNQADKRVTSLEAPERRRALLSLRWFRMGFGDVGVDAFLRYWIAIETLGTNVKSINRVLSTAYNISVQEAGDKFLVGRLQDWRGKIVHHGQIPPQIALILRYMEGLYSDLLCAFLGLPCPQKAGEIMSRHRPKILRFMTSGKTQ